MCSATVMRRTPPNTERVHEANTPLFHAAKDCEKLNESKEVNGDTMIGKKVKKLAKTIHLSL